MNDGGDRFDIIATLSGTEQELIDADAIMEIETARSPTGADA